ncbi:substrate-binding periplasmic protein [Massilia endophytica]|uniref:substrate-binding periplasmic protein n=1 Tax=Massilia endophytica TaxID=2899220 RepID=UPI001E562551|nr:transporter substrate-binding domain-containing protein [Massilia endophytica]UGQ47083.1 transporter substrate-binding domain-containing protein [Massilia endophytica]
MHILLRLLLACAASLSSLAAAAPLRVVTSDIPPLAIANSPARPGALVDLVREMARRAEVEIQVEYVPWKRALFLVSTVPNTAIFPITRTPEREKVYRWLVPLHYERFVFIAEEGKTDVRNIAALKNKRIAILRGSVQMENLKRQGFTKLLETTTVQGGVRLVRTGIADAVFGDQDIISGTAHVFFPDMRYAISDPLVTTETWLGGSTDVSDAVASRLQAAMKGIVKDGTYARVLRSYGLKPPQ